MAGCKQSGRGPSESTRAIGKTDEGGGCFLTNSSRTMESPTEADRGRKEP